MKNSMNLWKVLSALSLTALLSGAALAAGSSCDLKINATSQADDALEFDIHSSKANINPFKVTLSQTGSVRATWGSVSHKSAEKLKVKGVRSVGVATVRIESVASPTCYAESEVTLSPVMAANPASGCDLVINNFSESSTNLLMDIHSSQANINPFNVRIVQGTKEIGSWSNVPHVSGEMLKVDKVSASGEATVTVTSSKRAECTASRVVKIEGQTVSDKLKCKQGPVLLNISNITNTGLIAQFHGEDVFGIDYSILSANGGILHAGSVKPTNSSPSVTYPSLPQGKYKLQFKGNTCVGESSKDFAITSGPVELSTSGGSNGGVVACKAGPDIQSISNVSSSGLTAKFAGVDVFGIEFSVLNSNGSAVAGGSLSPKNDSPTISFSSLEAGNYTLVFSGSTCVGQSQKSFTISGAVTPNPSTGGTSGSSQGGVACKAGPEIKEIYSVTSSGLTTQFHGDGVSAMSYSILNSEGTSAANGSITPKNNTPSISYSTLANGSYTLVLKATNCVGESSKAFSIAAASTGSTSGSSNGGSSAALSSKAAGLLEATVNDKVYKWVEGADVRFQVNTNGTVKLIFPSEKNSDAGGNLTKPWIMNAYMVPLKDSDIEALKNGTMVLPEGNYTFYVYYINPSKGGNIASLRNNWWEVMMNPDTYQSWTGGAQYVMLEVRSLAAGNSNEVKAPSEIAGISWYPQYQETNVKLSLPAGKVYGITKRVINVSANRLIEQGQSIQTAFADVNGVVPWDKTWSTLRSASHKGEARVAYNGTIGAGERITLEANGLDIKPDHIISMHKGLDGANGNLSVDYSIPKDGTMRFVISNNNGGPVSVNGSVHAKYFGNAEDKAQELYGFGARPGNITGSEICENGIPGEYTEQIFRRIYELQKERDGISNVSQSNIIGDYFQALFGYGTDLNSNNSFNDKRTIMSSATEAQKGKLKDNDGNAAQPSYYYSNKAYEYRHRLAGGYLDGIGPLLDGDRLYNHISNLEKQYIAMSDRKVVTFGWTAFEGISAKPDVAGWQRLPLEGGDLIRLSRMEGSFEQLKYEAFFSLLVGDSYVSWNDNAIMGKDINYFGMAHIGGDADWKTKWQPTGGSASTYDANNPSHPKSVKSDLGMWSDGVAPGHNGGFVGAWLVSQIKNRVNQSLRYPSYSYSINGASAPGYYNGNDPVKGSKGAEVSRMGIGNVGQVNMVNNHEYKKPIVFYGEGSEGKVLIVLNPRAGLNETTTYSVSDGGGHTISHTGPHLGIYKL